MIADYEGDISNLLNTNVLGEVPILTTRNLVVFPDSCGQRSQRETHQAS